MHRFGKIPQSFTCILELHAGSLLMLGLLCSALQEFEERAAGHQPSLQQTSPADMAEDGKVMSETHAQGMCPALIYI